jgi:hypothetical protein
LAIISDHQLYRVFGRLDFEKGSLVVTNAAGDKCILTLTLKFKNIGLC